MHAEMKEEAIDVCITAVEKYASDIEKCTQLSFNPEPTAIRLGAASPAAGATRQRLFQMIKDQMDKKFGAPWHVVVGKAFSYEITTEIHNILYIYVAGRTAVLLWKM